MRGALIALALALVAGAARADEPLVCRNYDQQIAHYQLLRKRAADLDSDLWKSRLDTQLAYLNKYRLAAGCPDKTGASELARQLKILMELAATGAIHYFTMGGM
ncbi:MAG TPA: hypothetical protein VMS55_04380 [Myxococcota bacterium]|nr:hypothetical protein [Myxococcota bacterium]